MAQKIDLFKSAKEKAAQAGAFLGDKAAEARDKASQTGELLGNTAAEAKEKVSQTGELLGNKAIEAKDKAAQASAILSDKAAEAKRDYELRKYRPIMEDQLPSVTANMPEMIRIADWDKRSEEAVCKGAVAFDDGSQELRFISILSKSVGLLDVSFYPNTHEGVYYRDPSDASLYINLNDYFDYIKKAKVHELNQIAQALGARHAKITLKTEQTTSDQNERKFGAKVGGKTFKTSSSHKETSSQFVSIEVASNKTYQGHKPHKPELNYFKNEPDVLNIIRRRLDENNPIYSDIETFKYTNSSSIKRSDGVKIDSALKKFKAGADNSILSKVENEERILFEYQIEYPED